MSSGGRLSGRVALVTGGAKGLGRAYCEALAAAGARVAIADIVPADDLTAELRAAYGNEAAIGLMVDVADESSVRACAEAVLAWAGQIDVLVNNAAVFATLENTEPTDIDVALWDKVMAVNVRGPFLMVKHVAPGMIARRSGKIINIASGTAYKGLPKMLHYVTSKGAVLGFTRALSRDLGAHNICVNTLAPGLILSDSILANAGHLDENRARVVASRALKRDGLPDDVVGALVFLASAESDFITGQTILVDGGSINL